MVPASSVSSPGQESTSSPSSFGVDIWVEGKPPELVKVGSPFQMWNKGKDSLCPTSRIPRALGVCAGRNQQGGQGMPKSQPNDHTCMCGAAAGGQELGL